MAEERYRRLTRSRARSSFGIISVERCSLWLGSDHLLSIETTGYNERYKRFYFRDIQAFVLCRTETSKYISLACAVVGGLCGLFGLVAGAGPGRYVLMGLALPFMLGLGLNLWAGPTCFCQVRTAVQTEALPSLCRLRRTQWILGRLRPLIIEHQGQLSPGQAALGMKAWQEASGAAPGPAANLTPEASAPAHDAPASGP